MLDERNGGESRGIRFRLAVLFFYGVGHWEGEVGENLMNRLASNGYAVRFPYSECSNIWALLLYIFVLFVYLQSLWGAFIR